ncbi:MAG: hypothetical protein ABDI20_01520 [Candidatus Bipolaricaulaceae bacterium]
MRNRRGVAGAKSVGVLLLGLVAVGWINSDAELALAAYSATEAQARYGIVAAKNGSQAPVYLAGFSQLTSAKVEEQCELAQQALAHADSRYLEVPLEAVAALFEHRLGLTMEQLARFSLSWRKRRGRGNLPKPIKS